MPEVGYSWAEVGVLPCCMRAAFSVVSIPLCFVQMSQFLRVTIVCLSDV